MNLKNRSKSSRDAKKKTGPRAKSPAKSVRASSAKPLTEALPSSPVVPMDLPTQITGKIMDELDEKAIKPLQKSMREVISRLNDIMDSRDQLLQQVDDIRMEIHNFDQKQNEINTALQNQSSKQQELLTQLVLQGESRAGHSQPIGPKEDIEEKSAPPAVTSDGDQSTFRFYIDIYPRPDQTYAGRILHPLSKDKTSLTGVDGAKIESFIQKHLPVAPAPHPAASVPKSIKVIGESAAKQLQQHNVRAAAPVTANKPGKPSVIKFKLTQEKQVLEKAPYRLQFNKAFAVTIELSLPISAQDSVKSNYAISYQTNLAVLSLPQRNQVYNIRVNGGMNSKQPRDVKLINLNALARGKYALEINVTVPQKQIVEKAQCELFVD